MKQEIILFYGLSPKAENLQKQIEKLEKKDSIQVLLKDKVPVISESTIIIFHLLHMITQKIR